MKHFIITIMFFVFLILPIKNFGQVDCLSYITYTRNGKIDKKRININVDTTDKYIMCYRYNDFRLLIGYKSFLEKLDTSNLNPIKNYIDSIKLISDTIYIDKNIKLWTTKGHSFFLKDKAEIYIKKLLDEGKIKVFDFRDKVFVSTLFVRKKKIKTNSSSSYNYYKRIWISYCDISKREVFSFTIYSKMCSIPLF